MKKIKLLSFLMCFLTVFGCQTKQGTGSLLGAGGGAALGAIVGQIIGKDGKSTAIGAAIGAAAGAGAGAIIGRHMDKVAAEAAANVQNAKVEEVTDANGLKVVSWLYCRFIFFCWQRIVSKNIKWFIIPSVSQR